MKSRNAGNHAEIKSHPLPGIFEKLILMPEVTGCRVDNQTRTEERYKGVSEPELGVDSEVVSIDQGFTPRDSATCRGNTTSPVADSSYLDNVIPVDTRLFVIFYFFCKYF